MGVVDEKRAGFPLLAVLLSLMILSVEYCPRATSLIVADYGNSTTTAATTHLRNAAAPVLDHDREFKVEWLTADDMMLDFFKLSPHDRILARSPKGGGKPLSATALTRTATLSCGAGIPISQCLGELPPCKNTAGCRPPGY